MHHSVFSSLILNHNKYSTIKRSGLAGIQTKILKYFFKFTEVLITIFLMNFFEFRKGCVILFPWLLRPTSHKHVQNNTCNVWTYPAWAAFLHITTGPNWQWSPTIISCFEPMTTGTIHSGSVACIHSSMRMEFTLIFDNLGSPAPMQVQLITSAISSSSFSALFRSIRNLFSSEADNSPASSFNICNLLSSPELSIFFIWLWSAKCETGESIASRDLAHRRTTLRPVFSIFSVSWSTAVLDGAQTRIGPPWKKVELLVNND